jgi:succinate-acetate transporter protein
MVLCGIFHLLLNWGAKEIPKLLLISFMLLPVSALATHLSHSNIGGHPWLHIHVIFSVIFVYRGFAHIIKKRKALMFYIFGKKKKENIQQDDNK